MYEMPKYARSHYIGNSLKICDRFWHHINRHNPTRARPKLANLQSWLATTMALICRNALRASDAIIPRLQLFSFWHFSSDAKNAHQILAWESRINTEKRSLVWEKKGHACQLQCVFGDESSSVLAWGCCRSHSELDPVTGENLHGDARETRPCADAHFRPKVRLALQNAFGYMRSLWWGI